MRIQTFPMLSKTPCARLRDSPRLTHKKIFCYIKTLTFEGRVPITTMPLVVLRMDKEQKISLMSPPSRVRECWKTRLRSRWV